MEMLRVRSTMIHSIGYEPQTHILVIRLWTGFTYRYVGVPQNVHAALMAASSKGRFYNSYIRRNKYLGERIG
mgnify:CR=1 FL=1